MEDDFDEFIDENELNDLLEDVIPEPQQELKPEAEKTVAVKKRKREDNKKKAGTGEETKKTGARKSKVKEIKEKTSEKSSLTVKTKEEVEKEISEITTLTFQEISGMNVNEIKSEIEKLKLEIGGLEKLLNKEESQEEGTQIDLSQYELEAFNVPEHCVPIRCDVRIFDFGKETNFRL